MTKQEDYGGLDIETRLRGDTDQNQLNAMLTRIDEHAAAAKKSMDGGLPPEDFQAMSKYKLALETAADVMNRSWRLLSAS